jgi:hypothetical protein
MDKKEINIMESIIDSFVIDKEDRMLNFHVAILTMLKHRINPIELLLYIGESTDWATNDEDLKRYEYLDTDTIFASKMTEAYYRLEEV